MKLNVRINNTLKAVFPNVYPYVSYISTYGTPWGFVLASSEEINTNAKPETIDKLLAEKTTGGLKMLDGIALSGLFNIGKHLRDAIAAETQVYTLAEPPKFFGKGTVGK
jgi:spermidine synthase